MKVLITEVSGATFTSYQPYEAIAEECSFLTPVDLEYLAKGKTVHVVTYNRVGTRTKRIVKPV